MKVCAAVDCDKPISGRGFCKSHANKWRTHWPFEFDRAPMDRLRERIMGRAVDGDHGCAEWSGMVKSGGYGFIHVNNVPGLKSGLQPVHRVVWEIANGPIPEKAVIRHRCDNRPCCLLEHLEIGTKLDNYRDMVQRGRLPA